ncbi:MAG TPA: carbamoyl-phosphate synthase large subunit, partial [Allosphingosinicella sp.]
MPKRTDISSILIIGAGPIVIGQAAEFDYSGTQAAKTLKAEGYRIVLVNSNPATIMTDPELADATYVEPITPEYVAAIIEKERPDAVLPTMGGQTALNTALALFKDGTLEKYGVTMIGADAEAIEKAEDRLKFRDAMSRIGLESPASEIAHSLDEAMRALETIGLPAIIRPSFTLGGTGGGVAYNREEFVEIVTGGLDASPTTEVLIEESVLGWKEYEMEVVRDRADNAIIICSIENVDPMGIHTGDSITVAPALTLTDKEYQVMRNASIACLREIGVETGGSNVQFAVNPKNGRLVVIEMNPRVSRSSALASKATGFPIAKVAAKLAVGYTLDEIQNDITGVTPASFEPTIDYVVTKIPRFAFEKFKGAEPLLSTAMKSVGEAMAIGRSIHESLQKALRSLETGLTGLDGVKALYGAPRAEIEAALARPTPDRLLVAAQALREGFTVAEINAITHYDPWFLERLHEIVEAEREVEAQGLPTDAVGMRRLKAMGFCDKRLAELAIRSAHLKDRVLGKVAARSHGLIHDAVKALAGATTEDEVRALRHKLGVRPVFKRIDTCAAEFEAKTPYMYSTYEAPSFGEPENEAQPSDRRKVVILGGGPNRIGQGIEFDYCCCHACYALADAGFETIMINCNPETVSTDYDTSDRLYFEPLTIEDVLEIVEVEQPAGVVIQFGGQTPLRLAKRLIEAGVPILGTPFHAIDLAEDRQRFGSLLDSIGLKAPAWAIASTPDEAAEAAAKIGYPVLVRPSYVLGGRAMRICYDEEMLRSGPIASSTLVDSFVEDAIEIDVDAVSDGDDVLIGAVMEHVEEAGIHSGDSACVIPALAIGDDVEAEVRRQTRELARALGVVGLVNVQFAVRDGEVFVIEANPRASRTVPFVAKATGMPLVEAACRVALGDRIADLGLRETTPTVVSVKEAVLPFARFPGADALLGPEMRATGEVMGIGPDFATAFAKASRAAGQPLPGTRADRQSAVAITVNDRDK